MRVDVGSRSDRSQHSRSRNRCSELPHGLNMCISSVFIDLVNYGEGMGTQKLNHDRSRCSTENYFSSNISTSME